MKEKNGFTLVELIIVIAILTIVAAVAIPNILFAVDNARKSADLTNARVITESIQRVISEDNGVNRIDFTEVEFEDDVTGQPAAVELLLEETAKHMQSVPTVRYGEHKGSNYLVSIGELTGIVISVGPAGSSSELYPTPDSAWIN